MSFVYSSSSEIFVFRGLILHLLMLDIKSMQFPTIIYRPMRPSDLEALEHIHAALFPIRYEREFFLNVVNGLNIVSWAAVAINEPGGQSDELIGFVTTRTVATKDSEIEDLISYDISRKDTTLMYILTLGVIERYRNLGIASSLIQEVIKYASSIANCRAVYLHVIAYNHPAIHFYKKMLFKLARRMPKFYYINEQHYDSYLFVYYVNGGRPPCSPIPIFLKWPISLDGRIDKLPSQAVFEEGRDIVAAVATYFRGILKAIYARVWKHGEKTSRWSKCKETNGLLIAFNHSPTSIHLHFPVNTNPSPTRSTLSPFHRERNFGILAALPEESHKSRNPKFLQRKPSFSSASSSASTSPSSSARMIPLIPKLKAPEYDAKMGHHQHQSAPVNVPVVPARLRGGQVERDEGGDDEDEDEMMLPPHEIVDRAQVKDEPLTTFSVLEGAGRTLKGRDLRRVRNAVWRRTGFLD